MNPSHGTAMTGRSAPISTDQSASIRFTLHRVEQETQQHLLGPIAVIVGSRRQKRAVTTVLGLEKVDMRVIDKCLPRFRQHADKRVAERMEDQRGHAYLRCNT